MSIELTVPGANIAPKIKKNVTFKFSDKTIKKLDEMVSRLRKLEGNENLNKGQLVEYLINNTVIEGE